MLRIGLVMAHHTGAVQIEYTTPTDSVSSATPHTSARRLNLEDSQPPQVPHTVPRVLRLHVGAQLEVLVLQDRPRQRLAEQLQRAVRDDHVVLDAHGHVAEALRDERVVGEYTAGSMTSDMLAAKGTPCAMKCTSAHDSFRSPACWLCSLAITPSRLRPA